MGASKKCWQRLDSRLPNFLMEVKSQQWHHQVGHLCSTKNTKSAIRDTTMRVCRILPFAYQVEQSDTSMQACRKTSKPDNPSLSTVSDTTYKHARKQYIPTQQTLQHSLLMHTPSGLPHKVRRTLLAQESITVMSMNVSPRRRQTCST
jgi:hypothetical protein